MPTQGVHVNPVDKFSASNRRSSSIAGLCRCSARAPKHSPTLEPIGKRLTVGQIHRFERRELRRSHTDNLIAVGTPKASHEGIGFDQRGPHHRAVEWSTSQPHRDFIFQSAPPWSISDDRIFPIVDSLGELALSIQSRRGVFPSVRGSDRDGTTRIDKLHLEIESRGVRTVSAVDRLDEDHVLADPQSGNCVKALEAFPGFVLGDQTIVDPKPVLVVAGDHAEGLAWNRIEREGFPQSDFLPCRWNAWRSGRIGPNPYTLRIGRFGLRSVDFDRFTALNRRIELARCRSGQLPDRIDKLLGGHPPSAWALVSIGHRGFPLFEPFGLGSISLRRGDRKE